MDLPWSVVEYAVKDINSLDVYSVLLCESSSYGDVETPGTVGKSLTLLYSYITSKACHRHPRSIILCCFDIYLSMYMGYRSIVPVVPFFPNAAALVHHSNPP